MNRKIIRRWVNEYLDGEIGLADKVELERLMAQNPELRQEYKDLRKMGLLLSGMPEVSVHPYKFRQRLQQKLDRQELSLFSPQRVFAASMLVSLVIVCLTFGLFVFQQKEFGPGSLIPTLNSANPTARGTQIVNAVALETGVRAEQFFDRLALETGLGMVDSQLMGIFIKARIYDGAICSNQGGLRTTDFPLPLQHVYRVELYPRQVKELAKFAEGISGNQPVLSKQQQPLSLDGFLLMHKPAQRVSVYLQFK